MVIRSALRPSIVVLSVLNLMLLRWLYNNLTRDVSLRPFYVVHHKVTAPNRLDAHALSPPKSFEKDILERPIFFSSRRPFHRPISGHYPFSPRTNYSSGGHNDLILKGIAIASSYARAFLFSATNPDGKWLSKGDNVDGWGIAEIRSDRVVLANSQHERRTVLLYPDISR